MSCSVLQIRVNKLRVNWPRTLKSWGPNFKVGGLILSMIMKMLSKMGANWPPILKSSGPSGKDGGHWPRGPRLFPSLVLLLSSEALSHALPWIKIL